MSEYIIEHCVDELSGVRYNEQREEIVRCRDCKSYEPEGEPSQVYPDRYLCNDMCMFMPPDGFCSWGERR